MTFKVVSSCADGGLHSSAGVVKRTNIVDAQYLTMAEGGSITVPSIPPERRGYTHVCGRCGCLYWMRTDYTPNDSSMYPLKG